MKTIPWFDGFTRSTALVRRGEALLAARASRGLRALAAVVGLGIAGISTALMGAEGRPPWFDWPVVKNPVVELEATEANFPYVISIIEAVDQLGGNRPGNVISIGQVRGTKPKLEPGGIYWIKGNYTLASEVRGRVSLTLGTKQKVGVEGNPTHRIDVERGSGTFAFLAQMPVEGRYSVVWGLTGAGGKIARAGGVVFDDR